MDTQLTRREVAARRAPALAAAAFALCLCLLAGAPAAALAAGTVSVTANGKLTYLGGNQANDATIAVAGSDYVVTEAGIAAGTGCAPGPGPNDATCLAAGPPQITSVFANSGAGNDVLTIDPTVTADTTIIGGTGDDVLRGGSGADTVSYSTSLSGVSVNLSVAVPQDTGGGGTDTLSGIENLSGSPHADALVGSLDTNVLSSFSGDDQIDSLDGLGGDTVNCGEGTADRFTVDTPGDTAIGCEDDGLPPGTQISSEPPDLSGSPTAMLEFSSGDENLDHFECSIDGQASWANCSSPQTYDLGDGPQTFAVRGVDRFGHTGPPATSEWTIETGAPDLNIDSGPSGTIDTDSATFAFSSPDTDIDRFECNVDGSDWIPCQSPVTLSFLPEGPHTFGVRAFDTTGNVGTLTRVFTVALPAPPPAGGSALISRPAGSLVLIAGRAVKVTKRRLASVALNCSGTKECAGTVILATSKPVRAGRKKRIVKLGRAKFQIPAGKTQKVKVRISRRNMRLLRRMRKVNTDIIVKDLDRAGRARTSARTIVLKVPR